MSIRIVAIGPAAQPINGRSAVTHAMLDRLREAGFHLSYIASSPETELPSWRGLLRARVRPALELMSGNCARGATLYVAASGGKGLVFELIYLLVFLALGGRRAYLHHHSMAYVTRPMLAMQIIARLPGLAHIFLAQHMRHGFEQRYGPQRYFKLTNEWALPAPVTNPASGTPRSTPLLGHLSNLSFEKGLRTVIETFESIKRRSPGARLELAGYADPSIGDFLQEVCSADSGITYLGPLYGEAKTLWLAGIDVFLFPSRYRNEAYPLVLCEALAAGCAIVASDVGAIGELAADTTIARSVPLEDFERVSCEMVDQVMRDRTSRTQATRHYARRRLESEAGLEGLMESIRAAR